jgi:hypothetical protein
VRKENTMSEPVWQSRLDDKYDVSVTQNDEDAYKGTLRVVENGDVLLEEPVGISYGAPFGPDVADVAEWQQRAAEFIDGRET